MTKYQELEEKIKEMQAEVERLKKEEKDNQLPRNFNYEAAKRVLNGEIKYVTIDEMCVWSSTPQGWKHWNDVINDKKLTDKDIIQIQKWCIIYLEQQK